VSDYTAPAHGGALVSPLRWCYLLLVLCLPSLSQDSRGTFCVCVVCYSLGEATRKRSLGCLFFSDGHFHIISTYSERGQTFIGFARWSHFFDPLPLTRSPFRQDFFPPHPHSIHSPLAFILIHSINAHSSCFVAWLRFFFFCARLQTVYRQEKLIACSIIIAKIA